jgi:hypothetical protein
MNNKSLKLKSVSKLDYEFLYDLLLHRNAIENISHKKMPSFKQHLKFLNLKPYKKWYIIIQNQKKIGSIYLSFQNEIGIQLQNDVQSDTIQKNAFNLLIDKNPQKRYLVNINPHNKKKISFFKNNDFKLIQFTFEFIVEEE